MGIDTVSAVPNLFGCGLPFSPSSYPFAARWATGFVPRAPPPALALKPCLFQTDAGCFDRRRPWSYSSVLTRRSCRSVSPFEEAPSFPSRLTRVTIQAISFRTDGTSTRALVFGDMGPTDSFFPKSDFTTLALVSLLVARERTHDFALRSSMAISRHRFLL